MFKNELIIVALCACPAAKYENYEIIFRTDAQNELNM